MIFDSSTLAWHTGQLTIRAEDEYEEEEEIEEEGVGAGKEGVKDEEGAEEEGETTVAAPDRTEGDSAFTEPPPDVLRKKS